MTIDTFMEDTNDNERKMSDKNATREEFKHTKLENKSFVQGQKWHIHKKSSTSCFIWKKSNENFIIQN